MLGLRAIDSTCSTRFLIGPPHSSAGHLIGVPFIKKHLLQAIDAMERIRVHSPSDGDVVTALARLYHRVAVPPSDCGPNVRMHAPALGLATPNREL